MGAGKLDVEVTGELQAALFSRAQAVAAEMVSQDVANSLWALAKLRASPPEHVCAALVQAAERESVHMNSQDVANTVWAVAELQLRVGEGRAPRCARLSSARRLS